jgi:protein MpaA
VVRRTLLVVALLSLGQATAAAPDANAGGTAVGAPNALGAAQCQQGTSPAIEGVPASPVPPTVLGCIQLGGTEALVAAMRWKHAGLSDQTCFFVAPAGGVEVDGPCASKARRGVPTENALAGVRGVFPGPLRKVGDDTVYEANTPILSGQVSPEIESVALEYRSRSGDRAVAPAAIIRIREPLARRLGSVGRFGYFALRVPRNADTCKPMTVFGERRDPANWTRRPVTGSYRGARAPDSPYCLRRRAIDTARRVIGELVGLLLPGPHESRRSHKDQTVADGYLGWTQEPRHPGNLLGRLGIAGRSTQGRKVRLFQHGDPAVDGEVLVFGCIHGDECAARHVRPVAGCPAPDADIYTVPNLNPDGLALGTRLNARGVDLNRNFPSGWRPLGKSGSPQYSGPWPFSERETRLAARIIRTLDPEVTIWFHQHRAARPLVRAWGQSVPMAHRFAALAGLPFKRLPWLAGTAPNWQNHTFPRTASFVVEFPRGPISMRRQGSLGTAIVRLAREEVAN